MAFVNKSHWSLMVALCVCVCVHVRVCVCTRVSLRAVNSLMGGIMTAAFPCPNTCPNVRNIGGRSMSQWRPPKPSLLTHVPSSVACWLLALIPGAATQEAVPPKSPRLCPRTACGQIRTHPWIFLPKISVKTVQFGEHH